MGSAAALPGTGDWNPCCMMDRSKGATEPLFQMGNKITLVWMVRDIQHLPGNQSLVGNPRA
jgi:hypothetical protein